jgi:hypothetical protein
MNSSVLRTYLLQYMNYKFGEHGMNKRFRKLAGLTEAQDTRDVDMILRQSSDTGRNFQRFAETITMVGEKLFVGSTINEIVEMFDASGEHIDISAVESLTESEVQTISAVRAIYLPNQDVRMVLDMRTDREVVSFALPTANDSGEIYIDR